MSEPNIAVILNEQEHLKTKLAKLEIDHQRLKDHLADYERAEAAKERKNLIAGIAVLGSVASILISTIVTLVVTYKKAIFG